MINTYHFWQEMTKYNLPHKLMLFIFPMNSLGFRWGYGKDHGGNRCAMLAVLVSVSSSHWPRSFPLKAAWLRSCVRQATSPKPKLAPWPARGWTRWAASLERQTYQFLSKYIQHTGKCAILSTLQCLSIVPWHTKLKHNEAFAEQQGLCWHKW